MKWPKRHCLTTFCKKQTFIELYLTHTTTFWHILAKVNVSKSRKVHCALCHFGQTEYGCSICKVTLCKSSKINSQYDMSCFVLWRKHRDLMTIKKNMQAERRKATLTTRGQQEEVGNQTTNCICSYYRTT